MLILFAIITYLSVLLANMFVLKIIIISFILDY